MGTAIAKVTTIERLPGAILCDCPLETCEKSSPTYIRHGYFLNVLEKPFGSMMNTRVQQSSSRVLGMFERCIDLCPARPCVQDIFCRIGME